MLASDQTNEPIDQELETPDTNTKIPEIKSTELGPLIAKTIIQGCDINLNSF